MFRVLENDHLFLLIDFFKRFYDTSQYAKSDFHNKIRISALPLLYGQMEFSVRETYRDGFVEDLISCIEAIWILGAAQNFHGF